MNQIDEIRGVLKKSSNEDAMKAAKKFVPGVSNALGVRMPVINELAKKYKSGGFELAIALWTGNIHEEKLLAAKILGFTAKTDIERTFEVIEYFSKNLENWAICDTVALQSARECFKKNPTALWEISAKLCLKNDMWTLRLGIVLMWHYTKTPSYKNLILNRLALFENRREKYIKKAVYWIEKDLKKYQRLT